jgi:hypothetical protein
MNWTDEEIDEIVQDEDFDISAIYVLGKGKFELNSPKTDEAIDSAMREVRRKHKETGVPMVVWKDGKVVPIPPDEIEID